MQKPNLAIVPLVILCLGVVLGHAELGRPARVAAQGDHVYFIPDAQSPNRILERRQESAARMAGAGVGALRPVAPNGMEGWGSSTIDVQNRSDRTLTYEYLLQPVDGAAVAGGESVSAQGQSRINLGLMIDIEPSFYRGRVVSSQPAGVIVRSHWIAGGATAYEAPEASTAVVIPMLLHRISTLSTMFYIQNSVPEGGEPEENLLEYSFHSNATGQEIEEVFQRLRPGESAYEDTSFSPMFDRLPQRQGGGYIGALWLHGEEPIATLQYFEDDAGSASAALRAVPVSKGANRQMFPWARAGRTGGSLLGIASVAEASAAVTIRYMAASTGDEVARQTFAVAGRGAAYVDLGGRGWGTVPRASGLRDDFDGSIVVESDAAILASLYDQDGGEAGPNGSAYNAFGPTDMGTTFAAGWLAVRGKPSELVIQNGESAAVTVAVTFLGPDGAVAGSAERTVGPGARWTVTPSLNEGFGNLAEVSAVVEASGAIAVLVREMELGTGRDVAVSAAAPLASRSVPITPSRTSTSTPGTGTPTAPTPTGGTPTATTGTPIDTPSPTATGSVVLPFRVFLPRTFTR